VARVRNDDLPRVRQVAQRFGAVPGGRRRILRTRDHQDRRVAVDGLHERRRRAPDVPDRAGALLGTHGGIWRVVSPGDTQLITLAVPYCALKAVFQIRQWDSRPFAERGDRDRIDTVTRVLAERWSAARFTGVDRSPEMLAAAAAHRLPGRLQFVQGDIAAWRSDEPLDLIVSNAALHWVPGHAALLDRWAGWLSPGVRVS